MPDSRCGAWAPIDRRLLKGKLLVAAPGARRSQLRPHRGAHAGTRRPGRAIGLVLNRPSITGVAAPLPRWEDLAFEPPVVFVGGPVSEGAICLARVKSEVSVPTPGTCPFRARSVPWTSRPTRPSWRRGSSSCGSSPATRGGGRASSRARSARTPGGWSKLRTATFSATPWRPLEAGAAPAGRPAGARLSLSGRPVAQLSPRWPDGALVPVVATLRPQARPVSLRQHRLAQADRGRGYLGALVLAEELKAPARATMPAAG